MRLEERVITIPQKIIPELQTNKIFFIAEDGTEFNNCKDCENYEHELKKKNSKVYNTCISENSKHERLKTIEGYPMMLFYITCLNDIEELESIGAITTYDLTKYTIYRYENKVKGFKYNITYCDFELYGFGWYIVYWKEVEEIYTEDRCFVRNYNHYITSKTKEIEDYNKYIAQIMLAQERKEEQEKQKKEEYNNE